MKKMLLGIDEITIMLFCDKTLLKGMRDWETKAESMIDVFSKKAKLEDVFGEKKELVDYKPAGYTVAYQYGYNPFYFAIAYHPNCPNMGVVVKYSAHSWSEYCNKTQTSIKRFLHTIDSKYYNFRLSRIDFAVDYQDWDISVNDIYHKLINKQLNIKNWKGENNYSTIKAVEENGVASTFYVGSKNKGTRMFMRVYDKKKEQIDNKGYRFYEALVTKSWVRFEASFKSEYAHQLTNIILNTDEKNLLDLIADKITEKYRFYDNSTKKYTDFTNALLEKANIESTYLKISNTRDNDLIKSILHIVKSSGLFSTMYKCDEIWGNEESKSLLDMLYKIYNVKYEPNEDVLLWIKKHKDAIKSQSIKDDLELMMKLYAQKTDDVLS